MADGFWLTISRNPEWTWKLRRYNPSEVLDEGQTKTVQQGQAAALDAWYLSEAVAAQNDSYAPVSSAARQAWIDGEDDPAELRRIDEENE